MKVVIRVTIRFLLTRIFSLSLSLSLSHQYCYYDIYEVCFRNLICCLIFPNFYFIFILLCFIYFPPSPLFSYSFLQLMAFLGLAA